jgi:hypothetical protein
MSLAATCSVTVAWAGAARRSRAPVGVSPMRTVFVRGRRSETVRRAMVWPLEADRQAGEAHTPKGRPTSATSADLHAVSATGARPRTASRSGVVRSRRGTSAARTAPAVAITAAASIAHL